MGTIIALSSITILSELFYSSQTPRGLTFLSLCRISSLGLELSSLFRTSFSFPISLTLPLPQFPKLALLGSLGHGVFGWLVFLLPHVHHSFFFSLLLFTLKRRTQKLTKTIYHKCFAYHCPTLTPGILLMIFFTSVKIISVFF